MLCLQSALKERKASVELMGRTVEMDFNAGIFVTLNPAGKGYGGRSKLPDNLKALFRSVAMTVPDNEIIAEVLLLAEGFSEAKVLGRWVLAAERRACCHTPASALPVACPEKGGICQCFLQWQRVKKLQGQPMLLSLG